MPSSRIGGLAVLGLALSFGLACGRATGVPSDAASASGSQAVPFDHASRSGENPSSETAARLHEGTPILIRLLTSMSSASSNAGDTFDGTLDEPIVIAGQTLVPRGASVVGRVLAAKAAGPVHSPGYLRIALVSLVLDGKSVAIETSSLFVKGRPHRQADRSQPGANAFVATAKNEAGYDADRRLTFRLAQAVDLRQ